MLFDSLSQISDQGTTRTTRRGMHAILAMARIFKIVDKNQVDSYIVDQPLDHVGGGTG